MVTKAFIIGHDYGSFIYRVRIPLFETAGLNPGKETFLSSSIFDATSSYQPGNLNSLRVGDCVFVSFEDNRMGKPVIIGKLYSGHEDAPTDAVNASTISVSDRATLPADTTVGGMSVARIAQECQSAIGLLTGKVEKVKESSLMTDEEHRKLGTVEEGAERNVQSDWNATSGDAFIINKPTNVSQFANDAGYVPNTRTINGHDLKTDFSLSKSDVGLGRVENYYSTGDITDDTAYLLSGAVYNGTLCYYENTDRGLGFGFFPHYENVDPQENGNILGLFTGAETETAYTAVLLDSNTGGKPRLRFYYGDAKYSLYKETIIDGDGIHFYVGNTPFVEGATFDSEILYSSLCVTGLPVAITWDSVRHFVYPLLTPDGEMCSTTVAYRDGYGNLITDYYQPKLVSGTNIKTINGTSVLGSGNITVSDGGNIRSDFSSAYIGSSSKTIQVTFSPPMPDTNYSVAVTSRDSYTTASFSVYDKSTSGFTINVLFSGIIDGSASIDYIVVANT